MLISVVLLVGAGGLGFFFAEQSRKPAVSVAETVRTSPGLRIEQVRELAALVTLHVPISDLHVTQLNGLTGSIKMVLAVQGDVDIATDLSQARFEEMDAEAQSAVVVLPAPMPMRPRLDHERTRILDIHRTGMWKVLPGQAGEETLTNQAMRNAQRVLGEAAQDEALLAQGCGHTQQVISAFFKALGWEVRVQWDDGSPGVELHAESKIGKDDAALVHAK